ncbi:DUF6262 family protein [Legionella sainthelensi]|uniref:Transposase n=1 Tax=Legionella sainthelensi TaxID=28087 RepID=A0A2H5FRR6_9GAMM|nr:DUF6262 family protein [Legionella sainthelensi]AUH74252.1 transposase [Legionella sainthelensi]
MKNDSKQIQALKNAAQEKRAATIERVLEALKIMEEQNIPINFESVANFSQVSKTWVYAQPSIKEQIKNFKSNADNRHSKKDQAIKIRAQENEIDILSKQNKQLRQQVNELKQQLEVAYAALYKENK